MDRMSLKHLSGLNDSSFHDDNGCDMGARGRIRSKNMRQADTEKRPLKSFSFFLLCTPLNGYVCKLIIKINFLHLEMME